MKRAPWSSLDDEIADHLARETEDNIQRGMPPALARAEARKKFGSIALASEDVRAVWIPAWLDQSLQDLRIACRMLARAPVYTATAIATLATAIAASTVIFSLVESALLARQPYEADRVVTLGERWPNFSGQRPIARQNYTDWVEQASAFEHIAAITWGDVTISAEGTPVHVNASMVSPSYFDVLGLRPILGEAFAPDADSPGRDHVVVLSHRLWTTRFGSAPDIVGKNIRLDRDSYTVLGVMPAGSSAEFGSDLADPQLWRPLSPRPELPRTVHDLRLAIARLRNGVTIKEAQAQMDAIAERLARDYPDSNKGYGVRIESLPRPIGLGVESSLVLVLIAAVIVLSIVCVNLANLGLARGAARIREHAIRAALGASRWRRIRQLLAESLLIAAAGGLCGALVGYGVLSVVRSALPMAGARATFPSDTLIGMNLWTWLFSTALAGLTGIFCGIVPGVALTRWTPFAALRLGSAGSGAGREHRRLQRTFVVVQVALAFALLVSAGLLLQSFRTITSRIGAGFDGTNVLTAQLPASEERFASGEVFNAYLDEIASRIRVLPGVRDVAFADAVPTEGTPYGKSFQIVGVPVVPYISRPVSGFKVVSSSYFSIVGLRVTAGRALDQRDRENTPPVVVINQTMMRMYFGGMDPIGQRMLMRKTPIHGTPTPGDVTWTVVGVIADEGVTPFEDRTPQPAIYVTRQQHPRIPLALVVGTASDPNALRDPIRKAVWSLDPDQALADLKTVAELKADDVAADRLRSMSLAALAAVALALSALGLYGVVAYVVVQRTREFGIRAALGAGGGRLMKLVLAEGMTLLGFGLIAGLVLAATLTGVLRVFLFGVRPFDPRTLFAAAAILSLAALSACVAPAIRAVRVNPIRVLKSD